MNTTTRKPFTLKLFTLAALIALLFSGIALADDASDKWIHIKIDGPDSEKITVNLPIALIGAAVDMVPPEMQQQFNEEAEIALDDAKLNWGDLRNFWEQVRNSPDATYVTVEKADEKIQVKRAGAYMLVESAEGSNTQINVRFPMTAVDALLSGPEGTLNFKAALEALAREDNGHLVSVQDGETTVKIWIDNKNETN